MSDFKFACTSCGQRISCDTGYCGKQINCPTCKISLTVPPAPAVALSSITTAPAAAPPPLPPATQAPTAPAPPPGPARPPGERAKPAPRALPGVPLELLEQGQGPVRMPGATASGYSILAMVSLFCSVWAFLGCIPAIILGHKAKARIRANPLLNGEWMATAGLAIGYVFLALLLISGSAIALVQQHFQPIVSVRATPELLPAPERRVVDEVTVGENASERAHGLLTRGGADAKPVIPKGLDKPRLDADGKPVPIPQRTALNSGSFGYTMKVLPNEAMSVNCRYWGGEKGGGRNFDIVVNDQIIASQELTTNAPGHFMDVEYRIPRSLTSGQTNITVEFQAHKKLRAGEIFICQTLRP